MERSLPSPREAGAQGILVHVNLPTEGTTAVRVLPETTMEEILHEVCDRRFLPFNEHTLVITGTCPHTKTRPWAAFFLTAVCSRPYASSPIRDSLDT